MILPLNFCARQPIGKAAVAAGSGLGILPKKEMANDHGIL